MKDFTTALLLCLLAATLNAQEKDSWIAFWNKDTTLKGFKDRQGTVQIEPTFNEFTPAGSFDNIIAVTQEVNGVWHSYYLTKSGKIVGRDSIHLFDNGADCEQEGFIRFRDRIADKVGLFNRNGEVVVPAVYNELTRVTNGMIVALKGAEKKRLGEHYSWKGGQVMLIDTSNQLLIEHFKHSDDLNLFSLHVSTQPSTDSIRVNYDGVGGNCYSFIHFEKEFRAWLQASLLSRFTKKNLLAVSAKNFTFWKPSVGWVKEDKNSFLNRNFLLIKTKLSALQSRNCDYQIFHEDFNPYIYQEPEYAEYFDNCGEAIASKYPVKNIVISYKDGKELIQDQFEFLRTDHGYKLISITVRKGRLR